MGAIIKLFPQGHKAPALGLSLVDTAEVDFTPNQMGVRLRKGSVIFLTGLKKTEILEDSIVKVGQTVRVIFGSITPKKYEVLMLINPELFLKAHVSSVAGFSAKENSEVALTITPFVQLDLNEVDWYCSLYAID